VEFEVWNKTGKTASAVVMDSNGNEVDESNTFTYSDGRRVNTKGRYFIAPYIALPTSTKSAVTNVGVSLLTSLASFMVDGGLESFSAKTMVRVIIPKGGYLVLTNSDNVDLMLYAIDVSSLVGDAMSLMEAKKSSHENSDSEYTERYAALTHIATEKVDFMQGLKNTRDLFNEFASITLDKLGKDLLKKNLNEEMASLMLSNMESLLENKNFSELMLSLLDMSIESVTETTLWGFADLVVQATYGKEKVENAYVAGTAVKFARQAYDTLRTLNSGYIRIYNDTSQPLLVANIACPVDVEISHKGEVLSSRSENFNLLTSWGSLGLSGEDLDVKTVNMYENAFGEQKLYGTGDGAMDYTLRSFDAAGKPMGEFVFTKVPITASTVITPKKSGETLVLSIDKNGDGNVDSTLTAKQTSFSKVPAEEKSKNGQTNAPASEATPSAIPSPNPNTGDNSSSSNAKLGDIIKLGGYDYRILDVRGDNSLILSVNTLGTMPYNTSFSDVTWESCSLRKYLNGLFYDKLTQSEKGMIVETTIVNNNNPWYGTAGGRNTTDKIFLLSIEEIVKYFGDSGELSKKPANATVENILYISDSYDSARQAKNLSGANTWWWTRSPGGGSPAAIGIGDSGRIHMHGSKVDSTNGGGIRPAMWIRTATGSPVPSSSLPQTSKPAESTIAPAPTSTIAPAQPKQIATPPKEIDGKLYYYNKDTNTWTPSDGKTLINMLFAAWMPSERGNVWYFGITYSENKYYYASNDDEFRRIVQNLLDSHDIANP
jgi:hypothetical protein